MYIATLLSRAYLNGRIVCEKDPGMPPDDSRSTSSVRRLDSRWDDYDDYLDDVQRDALEHQMLLEEFGSALD